MTGGGSLLCRLAAFVISSLKKPWETRPQGR